MRRVSKALGASLATALVGLLTLASLAQGAPLGITDFFGNPGSEAGYAGGEFSTSPDGVAVNDSTGEAYVVDSGNNRIQRFGADGTFISAWGADVISGAATGTGNLESGSKEVKTVIATSGRFLIGQQIAGDGVPAETRIVSVTQGGPGSSKLVLSKAATKTATGVALTVAEGAGNVPQNEKHVLTIDPAVTTGSFKLQAPATVNPQGFPTAETASIPYNASPNVGPESVQAHLEAIPQFGAGSVEVTSPNPGGGAEPGGPYTIEFKGKLTDTDVSLFATSLSGLNGGSATLRTVVAGGSAVELCTVAAECKAGVNGGGTSANPHAAGGVLSLPSGIAVNQASGDLYVSNQGLFRVEQFEADGDFVRAWGGDVLAGGGSGAEVCETATQCQRGAGSEGIGGTFGNSIGYPAVVPTGAPNAGNVVVPAANKVQEFSSSGGFIRAFGWDVASSGPGDTGTGFEVCNMAAGDACKLGVAGGGLGQFNNPTRVAADTSGAIYALDNATCFEAPAPRRVQKFTAQGGPVPLVPEVFAEADLATNRGCIGGIGIVTTKFFAATDVAVDPTDDHVYVVKAHETGEGTPPAAAPERRVLEFDSSGSLVESHLTDYGINGVTGLGVKAGGARAYLTSSIPQPGVSILGAPVPPTASVEATTAVTATSATLNGTVNPNGGAPQQTTYRFEYSSDGGANWVKATPADTSVGSGEAPVAVSQAVSGLESNKDYVVRIVATKGGLPTLSVPGGAFKTGTSVPGAQTLNAWWDGLTGDLTLKARVNPNNQPTTYFFEYGPDDCSANPCTSVPLSEDASAGEGGKDLIVTQTIAGLDTETSYHYRVIATNAAGTATGSDRTVGPGPQIESCSNQALRVENDSESLPECRAYEIVSNADSNGLGIISIDAISDDGERAIMTAQALGDPSSLAGLSTPYVAERGAASWSIIQHSPDPATGATASGAGTSSFASDLSTVLWAQSTAKERASGEVQWLFTHGGGSEEPAAPHLAAIEQIGDISGVFPFRGASPDLSTFVFQKTLTNATNAATYVPGEPLLSGENGVFSVNLYQVTDAGPSANPSLVNRDVSDVPISNVCGTGLGGVPSNPNNDPAGLNARPISSDGSTVYFNARPSAATSGNCNRATFGTRVFKRVNDSTTVEVSKTQCTRTVPTPCSPNVGNDVFQGASADGESVFITSTRQLTDSDEDLTRDLYLYDEDPPAGQPTLIQVSVGEVTAGHPSVGSGAEVQGVVESSTDGSRVYFVAKGQLTSEGTAGANNLYVFQRDEGHPGGRVAFVAVLPSGDSGLWGASSKEVRVIPFYGPDGTGAGDGHLLLFTSEAKLLSDDGDSAKDLYRYDDEAGEMLCVSCQGDGGSDVVVGARGSSQPASIQESRIASEDATSVVFATEGALLAGDQNSAADVYLWREGVLSLISAGTGEAGSGTDAAGLEPPLISPDGERIFFTTKVRLFPTDQNSGLDAYVATIGGGFEHPVIPVSKCEDGQACRGSAPAPPPTSPPGSQGFSGSGDVKAPKACKKGKVKRKGRCVKRKQRKAKKRQASKKRANEKRANSNRGGNR